VLHSLVVIREAKGEGVGRALVETLLLKLRDAGVTQVYLVTSDTAQYFGYFGFTLVERSSVDPLVLASPELAAYAADEATCMVHVLTHGTPSGFPKRRA
jgi:N-acetylglutamate synthase-like GNAT family acetyltransferase